MLVPSCNEFLEIAGMIHNVLTGLHVKPLRIIIMGTAGTGKSLLIKVIRSKLQRMAEEIVTPVLVLAPTGVAAFNIGGMTIHSALSILYYR